MASAITGKCRLSCKDDQKADPCNDVSVELVCRVGVLQQLSLEDGLNVPISNNEQTKIMMITGVIIFFEGRGN